MSCTSFEFVVPKRFDRKLLKVFLRSGCGLTRESLVRLKQTENGITRCCQLIKATDAVFAGDVIRLSLPPEKNEIEPVEGALDILYEDDYLLIVNKPDDMPVHPTKQHRLDTLANIVADYQKKRGESCLFRTLNRLDKDTSGIVLIAKDRITYGLLRGKIQKEYVAVCEGVIEVEGVVSLPIALRSDSKIVREVNPSGKYAVTHYEPISSSKEHTLLRLWLETGRTHQIRCHMSAIGHPLSGDDLYGGSTSKISRQALHCRKIMLTHPFSGESVVLDTGIPEAFEAVLEDRA